MMSAQRFLCCVAIRRTNRGRQKKTVYNYRYFYFMSGMFYIQLVEGPVMLNGITHTDYKNTTFN